MLINMIGIDEEHVVDFESWKSEPFTDPTRRETLSMAVQAVMSAFAVGSHDEGTAPHVASPVSGITSAEHEGSTSRVHAA